MPLTPKTAFREKTWFKQVEDQLKPQSFSFAGTQFAGLFLTNFSWHFETNTPRGQNEVMVYFHTGGPFSLKTETVIQYIDLAAKQYGFVPVKEEEFDDINKTIQNTKK